MITRVLVGPLPHGLKHVLLDLDVLVADGWVVEGAEDVVDDFVHWYACVLPGIQHAAVQGSLAQWLSQAMVLILLTGLCTARWWMQLCRRTGSGCW